MTDLLHAAAQIQDFLSAKGWRFCFIGGVAFLRWGEPRLTRDVDISLFTGFGREDDFLAPLLMAYRSRIADAHDFARRNRVLLLKTEDGVPFDVALAGLPFEKRIIDRASRFRFVPEVELLTCSAEDLIVLKAFANRPQDRIDVARIVVRQKGRLNWNLIETELSPLTELKEEPAIRDWLRNLRQQSEPSQ